MLSTDVAAHRQLLADEDDYEQRDKIDARLADLAAHLMKAAPTAVGVDVLDENGEYLFTPLGTVRGDACDACEGAGWGHFESSSYGREVERCDSCAGRGSPCPTDEDAVIRHRIECGCDWPESGEGREHGLDTSVMPEPVTYPTDKTCPACSAPMRPCSMGLSDMHCDKCDHVEPLEG